MKELMEVIGKRAYINLESLKVEVEITDVKNSYGNTRYLVKPIAGKGEIWKESVELIKE